MKILMLLSILPFSIGCAVSSPFRGPKVNFWTQSLTVDPEKKVVVALTNARLIREKRSGFDQKSREIFQNINENPGYIGGSVRFRLLGDDVYTMTVWESLEDMKRFVNGRRHTDAWYMTNDAMYEFRHTHFEVLAKNAPITWREADKILNNLPLVQHQTP